MIATGKLNACAESFRVPCIVFNDLNVLNAAAFSRLS
jgi:hypothetical protein